MGQWFRKKCSEPQPHTHIDTNHNTHNHTIVPNYIHTCAHTWKNTLDSVTHIITNIAHINQTPWHGEHMCVCVCVCASGFTEVLWWNMKTEPNANHMTEPVFDLHMQLSETQRGLRCVCGHMFTLHMWWVNGLKHTHTQAQKERVCAIERERAMQVKTFVLAKYCATTNPVTFAFSWTDHTETRTDSKDCSVAGTHSILLTWNVSLFHRESFAL